MTLLEAAPDARESPSEKHDKRGFNGMPKVILQVTWANFHILNEDDCHVYIIQILTGTVMKYHVSVDCQESYILAPFRTFVGTFGNLSVHLSRQACHLYRQSI